MVGAGGGEEGAEGGCCLGGGLQWGLSVREDRIPEVDGDDGCTTV